MAADPLHSVAAERSHSLRLLLQLVELGIIARGRFSWVHVRHDWDCPALASGSGLDCCCNSEVEVAGRCYLFSDFVEQGGQS